jgi:hypothetical protein
VGRGDKAVPVGGDAPISVRSMTTTPTADVDATLRQVAELTATGCDIVRVAVPSQDDANALPAVSSGVRPALALWSAQAAGCGSASRDLCHADLGEITSVSAVVQHARKLNIAALVWSLVRCVSAVD